MIRIRNRVRALERRVAETDDLCPECHRTRDGSYTVLPPIHVLADGTTVLEGSDPCGTCGREPIRLDFTPLLSAFELRREREIERQRAGEQGDQDER